MKQKTVEEFLEECIKENYLGWNNNTHMFTKSEMIVFTSAYLMVVKNDFSVLNVADKKVNKEFENMDGESDII